ncbi:hypothetical protein J1N35_008429 [Gossypium stocksii]|uniref:Uncharacterized protein n=1 Tax=Gossypium stocksii TaxID=47602 RepID=A0A9D4AGP1_9ROSI|nr:hypothetical protein J1N35_008429 [Gossypium stocksii]
METNLAGLTLNEDEYAVLQIQVDQNPNREEVFRLGHNDSYCEAKMALGVEIAELGWDLSLRAQSRRALAMNSVWLREERVGEMQGNGQGSYKTDNVMWTVGNKNQGIGRLYDLVLWVNLEGKTEPLLSNRDKQSILSVLWINRDK